MDFTQTTHIYMDELSCDVDGFDVSLLHINKRRFINFYNVLLVPCMRMPIPWICPVMSGVVCPGYAFFNYEITPEMYPGLRPDM